MIEIKGIVASIIAFFLLVLGLYNRRINRVFSPTLVVGMRNKVFDITYIAIFAFFWVFGVCVTDSYDIGNYRWAFDDRVSHGKEPLFDVIQFFFHDIGWSFDLFKGIWFSVVVILLYRSIRRYSKTPGAVAGLALITVFMGFITQMRNALVMAIFLNAFLLLLSQKRRDKILYLVIVLLSAQIHTIAYAFLVFLFISPRDNRELKRLFYVIITVATFFVFLLPSFFTQAMHFILNLLSMDETNVARVLSFFQGDGISYRYAFFLICKHLLLFLLTDRACGIQMNNVSDTFEKQKYSILRNSNTLMLVFLPITLLAPSFERLFNCFALIQYAMVFNVGKEKVSLPKVSLNISLQFIMVVGILCITFVEWFFSPVDLITILNSLECFLI